MTPLLFIITISLIFWIIVLWQNIGYYAYVWQIKDYRFSRIAAHLREPYGYSLIFTKHLYLKIILFLALFLRTGTDSEFLYVIFFIVYFFECLVIFHRAIRGKIKFPLFTAKSFLLIIASFATAIVFAVLADKKLLFTQSFVAVDIASPLIVSFWVIILKPISYAAKQYIVRRAVKKRAAFTNLIAIGITGSFGKTSVKEFLAHILASKFRVAKTHHHQNTEVGAAHAILGMRGDTEIFVAEMGAYGRGDIKEISEVVNPTMGIITAIGPQHLGLFGSLDAIVETKFELAEVLPKDGALIVNGDNQYIKRKTKNEKRKTTIQNLKLLRYSVSDKNVDIWASEVKEYLEGLEFTVHCGNEKEDFTVNLLGTYNISNILAAAAAALECRMTLREIKKAAETITPLAGTMHLKQGLGGIAIIDDSYNASVDGVKAALDYMKLYKERTRIVIMPSLIELGEKAFLYHEELGREIAQNMNYAFITDTKYREAIWRGWKSVREDDANLVFQSNPGELIKEVKQVIDKKSVILLEGRIHKEIMAFFLHHAE